MDIDSNNVVRVAIQRPIYKLLDYRCDKTPLPKIGCRLRVPLGNSTVTALVVENDVVSEFSNLKDITEILDSEPLIDEAMMLLLKWSSGYYFYPLGEVLFHALPVALRKGKPLPKLRLWNTTRLGKTTNLDDLRRAPKQQKMLELLQGGEIGEQKLDDTFGSTWRNILKQLDKKEFVEYREVNTDYSAPKYQELIPDKGRISLTEEQNKSVQSIAEDFQAENPKPTLLHGITGSGKTEVYLRAIEPLLDAQKQILVLVPEIGLTPQLLYRFREHFPQYSVATLHSGLADGERLRTWLGAKTGAIDIIIGTRSAVFTPMKNLGAILIDEEHDASFKQQEGFLYQGRDMAIKRAHSQGIPVLLGSATPSLESMYNVNQQRYHYLRLASRPGISKRPDTVVQDIRSLPLEAGISNIMMSEIRTHLQNNNQVMIFLNRRGFAPVLMCPSCGWHAVCHQCEIGKTYHAFANKVICHHCGVEEFVKTTCPECQSKKLTTQGQGTERIEQVLNSHFPETPVIRVDRDTTSKKGSLEKKLKQVNKGDPVILIGTQMLTKGHDFPKLTLVGILDVDQALFSTDYRAQERLAQQVLQVSGRAGRGDQKGRVVLQTSQPDHPMLMSLLSKGYYQVSQEILNERKLWNYPPFGAQALIRVSSDKQQAGNNFLNKLLKQLRYESDNFSDDIDLLGPIPSPLAKRANRYRFQLLVSSQKRGELHSLIDRVLSILLQYRRTGGVRWVVDIDPMDFL